VLLGGRVVASRCVIQKRENSKTSSVVYIVEQTMVPLTQIKRFQEYEIAHELDFTPSISRRKSQIHDAGIGRIIGVDRIVDPPYYFFVGTGGTELDTIGKGYAG
jgi:hypothetical protein